MKAEVTVSVGNYDNTSRCHQFYEISSVVEKTIPDGGDLLDQIKENGTTSQKDVNANVDFVEMPPPSLHAVFKDNDDRHCVRLVHIPVSSIKPVEFFSSELRVSGFKERVYVSAPEQGPQRSYTSFCHFETSEPRCKQVVNLRPKMTPIDYRDTMVLLRDCTRKRFRTGMDCWPRLRPVHYKETCYVNPKRLESTYVSYCDYGTNKSQTRYHSALQVTPRAFCNNFVHGFEFNSEDEEEEDCASETEASSMEGERDEDFSGFMEDEGENYILNYNVGVRPVAASTVDNSLKDSDIWRHTDINQNIGQVRLSAMIAGGQEIINKHMTEKDRVDGATREVLDEKQNDRVNGEGRKSMNDKWNDVNTQKNITQSKIMDAKNVEEDKSERKERIFSGDLLDFFNDDDDVFPHNVASNTNMK